MKRIGVYNLITIILCCFSQAVLGQDAPSETPANDLTGKVSGRIVDAKNKPIPFATIVLLRSDSSVVNGDLSKEDGGFSISPSGFGNFRLRINAIGFNALTIGDVIVSSSLPEKNVGNIKLNTEDNTLKQVDIVGEKPLMYMGIDKKVFNVEKDITSSGGSALDVLQNVPSVSVDADGNVSLRGKPATILIDGKPATLLGGDITSALQSLPRSSIENLEVITNPSAKYDAQGPSGIINIVTKKDSRFGVNGNMSLGIGSNDKYNGYFGLNGRKGKWNIFMNSSFRKYHNDNSTITDRYNNEGNTNDYGSSHNYEGDPRDFTGNFNTGGVTYDWNSRNSITLTQNLNFMDYSYSDFSFFNKYNSRDLSGTSKELTQRTSAADGGPVSYATSFDYKHKFKNKDEELIADATYSMANYSNQQQYITIIYPDTGAGFYGPIVETAPSSGSNGSFTAWVDYTKPLFTKNGKLGAGIKTQDLWYQSKNMPLVDSPGHKLGVVDPTLLNNYQYTQQIHAAYINWTDQPLDKFSYQFGLRVEDALYNATNIVDSSTHYSNTFLSLFPSAFLSYQLQKQQTIYLSYTRRTNRPSVSSLMPFADVSNPLIISKGNPALEPEFINNIEFNYNKQTKRGDNIILSTYFQYTQNLIERITKTIDSSDPGYAQFIGKQLTRPLNLNAGSTFGFEATAHILILPFWDATVNANFFQSYIKVGTLDTNLQKYVADKSGFSCRGKINTSFKLPSNFTLQANLQYESPKVIAQGKMEETSWMDLAIKKTLGDNRLNIVFNVSDVFNTRKYISLYDIPNQYYERNLRNRETRVANLSITLRFGRSQQDKLMAEIQKDKKKDKNNSINNNQPSQKERENNLKENDDNTGNDQGQNNNNQTPGNKESNKGNGTHL